MKQLPMPQPDLLSISLRDEERQLLREALISHMKKTPVTKTVYVRELSHDRIRYIILGIALFVTAAVLVAFAR